MPIELQIFFGIMFCILGLCLGSFSNVLVYRLSEHKSLFKPSGSYCPTCGNAIKWYDNIPLLSYIILRGKCRKCKEKISIRYPIIEATGLLIFAVCWLFNYGLADLFKDGFTFSFNFHSITYAFMMLILFNIALIDFKTLEIPFTLSIPFMVLCIITGVLDIVFYYQAPVIANNLYYLTQIIGFIGPLVVFGLIYLIPYLIKKVEVIGLGDIILYCFIGLALGWINIILVVILSTLIASVSELIRMRIRGERAPFGFGPYIAIASIIVMIVGNPLVEAYLSLIGITLQ